MEPGEKRSRKTGVCRDEMGGASRKLSSPREGDMGISHGKDYQEMSLTWINNNCLCK